MITYPPVLVGLSLCVFAFALVVCAAWLVRHDVREARRLGRMMIGMSALAFPGALIIVPGPDPMFGVMRSVLPGVPDQLTVLMAASTAYLVGLAWMIRIHRTSHLERDASIVWRYRA